MLFRRRILIRLIDQAQILPRKWHWRVSFPEKDVPLILESSDLERGLIQHSNVLAIFTEAGYLDSALATTIHD